MRVVVVRKPDKDVLLISEEMQTASIECHFGLAVAGRYVRFAVVTQLLDGQFMLNAHGTIPVFFSHRYAPTDSAPMIHKNLLTTDFPTAL